MRAVFNPTAIRASIIIAWRTNQQHNTQTNSINQFSNIIQQISFTCWLSISIHKLHLVSKNDQVSLHATNATEVDLCECLVSA